MASCLGHGKICLIKYNFLLLLYEVILILPVVPSTEINAYVCINNAANANTVQV